MSQTKLLTGKLGTRSNVREFYLGGWGHNSSVGSHVVRPLNGRPYESRQHILHIKGAGGFTTLIMPRRKGAEPGKARSVTFVLKEDWS